MLDTSALGGWIHPDHLTDEAVAGYRDAMAVHPSSLIVLEELLVEPAAAQLAGFLAEGATFTREHGLYSQEGPVDAAVWEAAPVEDRFFRFGKLTGQKPEAMLSDEMLTYLRWRSFVTEPAFRGFMEAITGVELGPSNDFGCHEFHVGDFLLAHDDANRSRRIALVMYLTPGWRPEHGGALRMTAADGSVQIVPSSYNSMVVFDTLVGSSHLVEPIEEAAAPLARRTFGGWFPNRP